MRRQTQERGPWHPRRAGREATDVRGQGILSQVDIRPPLGRGEGTTGTEVSPIIA